MSRENLTHFGYFFVSVAFEVEEPAGQALKPWDDKPLRRSIIRAEGIQCVIVSLGIYGTQYGRFLGRNSGQLPSPARKVIVLACPLLLDLSEQPVVVALQQLVGSGFAARIENELNGANDGYSDRRIDHLNAKSLEKIARSGRAQDDDEKIEAPSPELEGTPPRCVIERVSDGVEPQVFPFIVHCFTYFFAGAGAGGFGAGADGCLGPGPAPGFPELVGCRGPRLLISIFPEGRATPKDFFHSIQIVSMWCVHMAMKASARGCARADADQYQFSGWLS